MKTDLRKALLPLQTHTFIFSWLNAPLDACKRRPRARNTGRRSIAAGVFNPPPRNEVTEQCVLDFYQDSLKTILGPPVPAICREIFKILFSPFGPNFAPRRPKTASRSHHDAHLRPRSLQDRPRSLQDRYKTAEEPNLTPTWAQLGLI